MIANPVIKRRACVRGSIPAGHELISRSKFERKHKKQPQSRQISDRKLKEKMRKGKLETFQSKFIQVRVSS